MAGKNRTTRSQCVYALGQFCRRIGRRLWDDLTPDQKRSSAGHLALTVDEGLGGSLIVEMIVARDGTVGQRPAFGPARRTTGETLRAIRDAGHALDLLPEGTLGGKPC